MKTMFFTSGTMITTAVLLSYGGFGGMSDTDWRPYISTRLARVIMLEDSTPDVNPDTPVALCDGSGWITHGDGHQTRCPGCIACENNRERSVVEPEIVEPPVVEPAKKPQIQPPAIVEPVEPSIIEPAQPAKPQVPQPQAVPPPAKYKIYHFGASWCFPCTMMKRTWNSESVLRKLIELDAEIFYLDNDNPEHMDLFRQFGISSFPTIIIVKEDYAFFRWSGFRTIPQTIKILQDNLK